LLVFQCTFSCDT